MVIDFKVSAKKKDSMSKLNNELILIPHIDLPFHWSQSLSHIEVWLTLEETKQILKRLGAGTYAWAEPENYTCNKTVLSFLGRNMALSQEVRLTALGLYDYVLEAA